ncbi:hypothetical protein Hanom_Chr09g00812321 [Helianthus anomalus]
MMMMMMMTVAEQGWWWRSSGGGGRAGVMMMMMVVVAEQWWWWRSRGGAGVEVEVVPRRGKILLGEAYLSSLPQKEVGERLKALLEKKNKHSSEAKTLPVSARCRQKRPGSSSSKKQTPP